MLLAYVDLKSSVNPSSRAAGRSQAASIASTSSVAIQTGLCTIFSRAPDLSSGSSEPSQQDFDSSLLMTTANREKSSCSTLSICVRSVMYFHANVLNTNGVPEYVRIG